MSALDNLLAHTGDWRGDNRLWISPDQPPEESPSTATVVAILDGRFLRIDQTWAYRGDPQSGSLLLGYDGQTKAATAHWIDSFHMGCKVMACPGIVKADGAADVRGSYAAPPGPDWGWRIQVAGPSKGQLEIVMYNIHPDGKEELAVRAAYARA